MVIFKETEVGVEVLKNKQCVMLLSNHDMFSGGDCMYYPRHIYSDKEKILPYEMRAISNKMSELHRQYRLNHAD